MATTTISPAATEALRGAEITGNALRLVGQLDRTVYVEVNKVLERLGGKWHRSKKAHLFDGDPAPGYVRVLEPSAGDGAIVAAIARAYPEDATNVHLTLVEPDPGRQAILRADGYRPLGMTFEEYAATVGDTRFDAVVMNPPFATPGNPVLWAQHVLLAWEMVADGGTLAAVIPNAMTRQHKTVAKLRDIADLWGWTEPIADDAFKASGTNVRTALLVLERT